MRNIAVFLCAAAAIAHAYGASVLETLQEEEWKAFKLKHKKQYNAEEDGLRKKIFAENQLMVARHNQEYARGLRTYTLAINKYADLLYSERIDTFGGCVTSGRDSVPGNRGAAYLPPVGFQLAEDLDWRNLGAVTSIKDQRNCKACWAFTAAGALEGQMFRKTGKLVSLSAQNLVDCADGYDNSGCEGGNVEYTFNYISDHGVDSDASYPYEAIQNTCRFNKQNVSAEDVGFLMIARSDELSLHAAVTTVGPVAASIHGSLKTFMLYSDGVFYDSECSPTSLDHAVLVVGYGTDETGGNYWLVKNSWGPSWGQGGYGKIARNRDNHCGIATRAVFPIV